MDAVRKPATSKEYAEILTQQINDEKDPLLDSLNGSIREGIQEVKGQDLAGEMKDVEKSKHLAL